MRCIVCKEKEAVGACSGCRVAVYCSRVCWEADQAVHARLCGYAARAPSVALGAWPPADLDRVTGEGTGPDLGLKALFKSELIARDTRLDAIARLAARVSSRDMRFLSEQQSGGGWLGRIGRTAVRQFDVDAAAFDKSVEALSTDVRELLGQPYWYSVDAENKPISSAGASTARILPFGPAPGMHTIDAPSYTPDTDGVATARPPLKRALVQLLLTYWADEYTSDQTLSAQIGGRRGPEVMPNLPYVEGLYGAVETKNDKRTGLYVKTIPARHELIPFEELLGEYAAVGNAAARSPRAKALADKLAVRDVPTTASVLMDQLQALVESGQENESVRRLVGEIIGYKTKPMTTGTGAGDDDDDGATGSILTEERYAAFLRLLKASPDLFYVNDPRTVLVITNIITQVLYTVWFLQQTFECTLSNLTVPNLFVVAADPTTVSKFYYPIGETLLSVDNIGVRVVIPNLEHAVLTVRLGLGYDAGRRVTYHVTSTKSVQQVLTERLMVIPESRAYAANLSPRRYDPVRDVSIFFNSLALEPRWGLHKHPLVVHYLGREERAHVFAFGTNRMFRRVSLDYMMAFGMIRQSPNDGRVMMAVHKMISTGTAALVDMTRELNVRNAVNEDLVDAVRHLVEFYTDFGRVTRTAAASDTPRSILSSLLAMNPMRTVRLVGALSYLYSVLRGGRVEAIGRISVLRRITDIIKGLWESVGAIGRLVFSMVTGRGNRQDALIETLEKLIVGNDPLVTADTSGSGSAGGDTSVMWTLISDATSNDNTANNGAARNRVHVSLARLLRKTSDSAFKVARQIVAYIIPNLAATYVMSAAREMLERHFRPLLTRDAIISGAAMPSPMSFLPYQLSMTTLRDYVVDVTRRYGGMGATDSPLVRPRDLGKQTTGKKRKISDTMPRLLEILQRRRDEDDDSGKVAIDAFLGPARTIAGIVSAARLRAAVYGQPTDLVGWFAHPEHVADENPVLEELVRQRDMVFGAGKQGFVMGYEGGSGEGFRAIKYSNAVNDLENIRPVEMTRTSVVSSPQINEILVSAVVSELYERGVSPHFVHFHGAMLTKVSAKTSFVGRTGYRTAKEAEAALDDFIIDLLEHDHGADMSFVLTNIANTVSIVLIESIIAYQFSRAGQYLGSVLEMVKSVFAVLQRSVDDMAAVIDEKLESPLAAFAVKSLRGLFVSHSTSVAAITDADNTGALVAKIDDDDDDDDDDGSGGGDIANDTNSSDDGSPNAGIEVPGPVDVPVGDLYSNGRLMSMHATLTWLATYNPAIVLTLVDALRRAFNLVGAIGPEILGATVYSHSTGEGSAHISASASESLRLFAAYKTGGVKALPRPLRRHVERWTGQFASVDRHTGGAAAAEQALREKPMYQIVSSMEAVDGDFASMDRIAATLQAQVKKELIALSMTNNDRGNGWQDRVPTLDEYIENATVQTVLAIAQFQQHCAGNHFDFHPANIFVKYCDDTLFGGKALSSYDYFDYHIEGRHYRVPNLGFVVKLGDMGHSTLNLQRTGVPDTKDATVDVTVPQHLKDTEATMAEWRDRLIIHKSEPAGVEALFAQNIGSMRYMLNKMAETVSDVIPPGFNVIDVANKLTGNLWARHSGSFLPAYDLGHFMNALAMMPFAYRNRVVHEYHLMERLRWIATYGSIDGMPQYSPNIYFPILAKYSHPVADKQLTTPLAFIESANVFAPYRVQEDKATK